MPIEQLANTLAFYAMFAASKVGKTGLTVTVDVWEITQAGVATEVVTGGAAVEIGDGLYRYQLASGSVDAVGEYIAMFKTADGTVDMQHIPAIWVVGRAGVEFLDAAISSVDLSGGTITYLGPVAPGGEISIVQGDDYSNTDGRALEWSTTDASTWPTLTGATIKVTIKGTTFTGEMVTGTGANKKVRLELTAAQTAALPTGQFDYDVEATLASTREVTLARGLATILADVTQ